MPKWEDISFAHATILGMASPLTQRLDNPQPWWGFTEGPSPAMVDKIWCEVFELEWEGNFKTLLLPAPSSLAFRHIKTRKMLYRCKDYFTTKYSFPSIYLDNRPGRRVSTYQYFFPNIGDRYARAPLITIECVLTCAMENVWLTELTQYLKFPVALAHAAVYGGHVRLLKYLVRAKGVDLSQIRHISCSEMALDTMIDRFGFPHYLSNVLAMDVAARFGHLEMIKYLHAAGSTACSTDAFDGAARCGNLEVLKWLHENRTEGCTSDAANNAIIYGHIDVLKYLRDNEMVGLPYSMDEANSLEMIKFLHEECQAKCSTEAMKRAVAFGRLDVVKYLYEHGTKGSVFELMDIATKNNHLNVIKFLNQYLTVYKVQINGETVWKTSYEIDHYLMRKRIRMVMGISDD